MDHHKRLSDLDNKEFAALWKRNAADWDDLAHAPGLYQLGIPLEDQSIGIAFAIQAAEFWREKEKEFFLDYPYRWISSPECYSFSVEAAFQVRILELVFALWKRRDEYGIDIALFGELSVRQTVVPRVAGATPRAANMEGHGLILMPLGWFDSLHCFLEAARFLKEGKAETARALILENLCRALADQAIQRVLRHAPALTVDPHVSAFARVGVAEAIARESPLMRGAYGKLDPATCLPGLWNSLTYGATTFALAHEAAHILGGEHLEPASKADEERADDIAFDATTLCTAWQDRCPDLPAATHIGKTCAAVIGFLHVNMSRLTMDRLLQGKSEEREAAFRARAAHLQIVAGCQPIPEGEREMLTALADSLTEARQFQTTITQEFKEIEIEEIRQIGELSYKRTLRELSILGGVDLPC